MRPDNIGNYLEIPRREKELCIIDRLIDPYLEPAEIERRVLALSMAINLPT
jgi:hypothetical protein